MKHCKSCATDKLFEEFSKKGKGYHFRCKACQREYGRAHYHENKSYYVDKSAEYVQKTLKWVNEQKDVPCVDCGNKFPSCAMDFDHLADKEFNIATAVWAKRSIEALKVEIAKCEVVCACCHRVRTWQRNQEIS